MKNDWTQGGTIAQWNVSAALSCVYRGTAQVMPDVVTYKFENGWVDTGDLPCRQALRAEISARDVSLPEQSYPEVYLAGPSGDVDFSDFCHVPEWRVRHAQVRLTSPLKQVARVRVHTAGAVHLWCDDRLVHKFEPFTRNQPQHSEFDLALAQGGQKLTVRFEDLHERDTVFGFRLELLDGEGIVSEILCDADPATLADVTAVLEGLRTEDVFHTGNTVRITSEALSERACQLHCLDLEGQGGVLSRAQPSFEITAPPGCYVLRFATELGNVRLTGRLGTSVMPDRAWLEGDGFEARAKTLKSLQNSGDDIVIALLALAQNRWDETAERLLNEAISKVEDRHDCADFRMMSLLWIWERFQYRLSKPQADRLEKAILGFRYWMDEPGNDVMWFWSENHVLCFHIAQFLAGQMMPAATFVNSGRSGAEQEALGAERLNKWFDAIDAHGLAEWNSAAYYPINYRALLALYTLSRNTTLKARARVLLDQISQMVALHMAGGVAAGSQGRAYEKELLAGPMTELGAVGSLMFGGWHVPGKDAAAVMLALSSYRPNPDLKALSAPAKGTAVCAQYCQGLGGQARLAVFKTAHVQLSTVEHLKPHEKGHQQHVLDLRFANDPLAGVWVNHPGTLRHWAEARPSFWAGNGRLPDVVQDDNVALMLFALQKDDIPFTHLFLPRTQLDEVITRDQWLFLRGGSGYAAIWAAQPLMTETTGLYAHHELRQTGPLCGWAIRVGDSDMDGPFSQFIERSLSFAPQMTGTRLRCGNLSLDAARPAENLDPLPLTPMIKVLASRNGAGMDLQDALS